MLPFHGHGSETDIVFHTQCHMTNGRQETQDMAHYLRTYTQPLCAHALLVEIQPAIMVGW